MQTAVLAHSIRRILARHPPPKPQLATHLPAKLAAELKDAASSVLIDNSFRQLRLGYVEHNRARFAAMRAARRAHRLWRWPAAAVGEPQRTISTAKERQIDPGIKVRTEGQSPTGDDEVDEAYDGLGATFNLYWQIYQRNSIDNQGLPLNGTVHFGRKYDNAFWNGQRMNFGDGDKVTFQRFTIAVDIMGHELTHGVTQYESNLIYWGQTGALNEHISDVFGSLVKQYQLQESASAADWLIGAGLFEPGVNGVAIRSMKAPGTAYDDPALGGKDPQPSHMKHYQKTFQDNGGVHINSGIPNHAFYLAAIAIGGYAWEKAGMIWYEACTSPLMSSFTNFQSFAELTLMKARELYGINSQEETAVGNAWDQVGISV